MKKTTIAFKLAHSLYQYLRTQFTSFSVALKAAWKIIKDGTITFVKESGEIRTATIEKITMLDKAKGFAKFIEKTEDGTQYRSFRFERVVVCA